MENNASRIDFNPTVRSYYTELKECKPIKSRTREKNLIKKAKRGDKKAQNELLNANLRFVFDTAKKYRGYGVPMEELISEGNMGLIYSIEKFDTSNDVKFITYASWWIKFYMSDLVKRRTIRASIEKNEDAFIKRDRDDINIDNVPDYEDEQVDYRDTVYGYEHEDQSEDDDKKNELVRQLLSDLSDREREIIIHYFGLNGEKEKNLEEISHIMNLSRERVRQIKQNGIMKMRTEVLLLDDFEFNLF